MVNIATIALGLVASVLLAQSTTGAAVGKHPKHHHQGKGGKAHGHNKTMDIGDILHIHNKYRAIHRAPPLSWDNELASYAQNLANSCVYQHSGGPNGEILLRGFNNWDEAISAVYSEGQDYVYNPPMGLNMRTRDFTQVNISAIR